jgi:DNA-binding PadR family transcriptional regulator
MVEASERGDRGRGRRRGRPEDRLRDFLQPLRLGRAMARRGVRTVILAVLARQPMHGYQVMQELEARSGGRWRPSAGSVYPTLQQLEDEGLVRSEEAEGRRVYTITDQGKAALAESPLGRHPLFGSEGDSTTHPNLRKEAIGLVGAAVQVSRVGSPAAQAKAREVLVEARRRLYGLLAEDEGEGLPDTEPEGDDNSDGGTA